MSPTKKLSSPPAVHVTEQMCEDLDGLGLDLELFKQDFIDWRRDLAAGREHYYFGRDAKGLGNPALHHVHLIPLRSEQAKQRWDRHWKWHKERTSDCYLLYADGTPAHGYLLITLIADPGGHAIWSDRAFVELLEGFADDFHHFGKLPD